MSYWKDKVAIVTGGSAGFGFALSRALVLVGANVVVAARDPEKLDRAVADLRVGPGDRNVVGISVDVTDERQVEQLKHATVERFGRIDLLVNNVGRSTRGRVLETTPEQFREFFELNFLSAVRCTRAVMPHLLQSRGHLVNIGSLASKTVTPHLGAYPAGKFALAAFSQQLRYELGAQGVHILLVCPGPIARTDSGHRYAAEAAGLSPSAQRPGGGVQIRRLDADHLARRVLSACERRQPELVLPAKAKLLLALAQLSPRLGDWIVSRMTKD